MRIHSRLLKTLWVDAVNITTYLINRVVITLEFKLLEEVSTKKKKKKKKIQVLSLENF